jgi:hypothetical protein
MFTNVKDLNRAVPTKNIPNKDPYLFLYKNDLQNKSLQLQTNNIQTCSIQNPVFLIEK